MKRSQISLFNAISIVIGCVIGSGIFAKPGRVLQATGNSNEAILAWVLGGVIALLGALTLAEIAARIPRVGGIYTYSEEIYGKPFAFINGWMQSIIYGPALSAGIGLYFSSILAQLIGLEDQLIKPISIALILVISVVNTIKMSWGTTLQNLANFGKLIPIFGIIIAGLFFGDHEVFNTSIQNNEQTAGLGVAILATFWAYDGWVQVSNLGDEIKNPIKNIPRAFIYGIIFIMTVYIVINLSIFKSLPINEIISLNENATSVAAENIFGSWAGKIISFGILIGMLGAVNGNIITMPLISYSMSKDKLFPFSSIVGKVSKTDTPANAIMLQAFISIAMILFFNVERITDIAMFTMYLFYCVIFFGLFILRKKSKTQKVDHYQVPFYPVVPVLAIFGSLFVCYSMLRQNPLDAVGAIIVCLIGYPIYLLIKRTENKT